jgi:hypothetical protein
MLTYFDASAGGGSLTAPQRGITKSNEVQLHPIERTISKKKNKAKTTSLILSRVVIITSI